MRGFVGFTKRNLLIYFKDVQAVIFSLLTSIIVFVLYLIFLKGTYVDTIESAMKGLENFVAQEDVDLLVSAILLVGIVGSAMVTVPYSCLTTLIKDKEMKIDFDISATPIRKWQVVLSYFTASVISAFCVTGVVTTIGLLMLSSAGDLAMDAGVIARIFGVVAMGCVSSTAFFMIFAMLFKTTAASSAFFGILSAASGFLIGAYIPLSQFSEKVQTVCYLYPGTQVTVLLRRNILSGILDRMNDSIGGIDQGAFVDSIKEIFNFKVSLFGNELSQGEIFTYLGVFFAVNIVVMVLTYMRTYKRR